MSLPFRWVRGTGARLYVVPGGLGKLDDLAARRVAMAVVESPDEVCPWCGAKAWAEHVDVGDDHHQWMQRVGPWACERCGAWESTGAHHSEHDRGGWCPGPKSEKLARAPLPRLWTTKLRTFRLAGGGVEWDLRPRTIFDRDEHRNPAWHWLAYGRPEREARRLALRVVRAVLVLDAGLRLGGAGAAKYTMRSAFGDLGDHLRESLSALCVRKGLGD